MKKIHALIALAALAAGNAFATPISGTSAGAPPVAGATETITFENQAVSSFASTTIGSVTFTGLGRDLDVSGTFAGNFNTTGSLYLENAQGATPGLRFDFATTVSSFAFNWGASNNPWVLTAYDAAGNVLDSMNAPITAGSRKGDYIGLADAGIAYATLTTVGSDWILIDNFTLAAEAQSSGTVPEPASLALFGAALAGIAGTRRRKTNKLA